MRAEYANAFIKAAIHVFEKESGVRLSRKDIKLKGSAAPSFPVSIIIGASGALLGQVVFSMDESFAYELTRQMLPGKLPADLKKLVGSAVGEVANMITGRSAIELAGDHDTIHITAPEVHTAGFGYLGFLNIPTINLGFLSNHGGFEINLALIDAPVSQRVPELQNA